MKNNEAIHSYREWTQVELLLFRFFFIFFVFQALPLDWKYYYHIGQVNWSDMHYSELFYLARYTPQFVNHEPVDGWGLNTLYNWTVIVVIAVVGILVWSYFDKRRKEYNFLYYLLRVLLRYRLAIAAFAYGFLKIFPMQLPYPSISLANTNYGDMSDWMIVHLAYGIAPSFEVFLGVIEILGGVLLLNRKSASIGAMIILGYTGNVFLSNLAYNGTETGYAFYLLSMAAFVVIHDVQIWHRIIMLGKPSAPNRDQPEVYNILRAKGRKLLKIAFMLIVFSLFAFHSYSLYRHNGYQYPGYGGLTGAAGLYNVREFKINGNEIAYSLTDSTRWKNVVFEQWPTISILSNRRVIPDTSAGGSSEFSEKRNFESSGSSARHFYEYTVDTATQIMQLKNKNRHYPGETMVLQYKRIGDCGFVLAGRNETGDSIYVALDKISKIYLLDESYQIPKSRSVFD